MVIRQKRISTYYSLEKSTSFIDINDKIIQSNQMHPNKTTTYLETTSHINSKQDKQTEDIIKKAKKIVAT